jgi:hypothetical protein
MIRTPEYIYVCFRKAQAEANNRGYRIPKDFEKHLNERMSDKNKNALILVTSWFLTKWKDIDPYRYFQCGFELFKTFTYVNFTDPRVMKYYIQRDKNIKRYNRLSKKRIIESLKFIKGYMVDKGVPSFGIYCLTYNQNRSLPVKHYLENKIDKFFIVWLMSEKLLKPTEDEMSVMPYVIEGYRDIVDKLGNIKNFLVEVRKKL